MRLLMIAMLMFVPALAGCVTCGAGPCRAGGICPAKAPIVQSVDDQVAALDDAFVEEIKGMSGSECLLRLTDVLDAKARYDVKRAQIEAGRTMSPGMSCPPSCDYPFGAPAVAGGQTQVD